MKRFVLLFFAVVLPTLASASGVQHNLAQSHPVFQQARQQAVHNGKGSVYGAPAQAWLAPVASARQHFDVPHLNPGPWAQRCLLTIHELLARPKGPLATPAAFALFLLLQVTLLSSHRARERLRLGVPIVWSIRPPPIQSL